MRKYYYSGIMCPSCGYPYSKNHTCNMTPFLIDKSGMIRCPNCDADFKHKIRKSSFKHHINKKLPFENTNDGTVPLYRECFLNDIEVEYIEWLLKNPSGHHLILWPWKEINFLPAMANEYILKYPDKKILIIGDFNTEDTPGSNNPLEIIKYLFSINQDETKEPLFNGYLLPNTDKLKNELYRQYTKEDKEVKISYKSQYSKKVLLRYEYGTFSDIKKKLSKEFKDVGGCIFYTMESNGSYKQDRSYLNKYVDCNDKYITELYLEKSIGRWSGESVKYRIRNMDDVVNNLDSVLYCNEILNPGIIDLNSFHNIQSNLSKNLLYLKPRETDYSNPSDLFNIVNEYSPDIFIITNMDSFTTYNKYGYKVINPDIINLLPNCTSLLFSTNQELRQCYSFSNPKGIFGNNKLIVHSVDSKPVIDNVLNKIKYTSTPNSPLFTHLSFDDKIKYGVEYIPIVANDTSAIKNEVINITDISFKKQMLLYLNELGNNPLKLSSFSPIRVGLNNCGHEYIQAVLQNDESELYNKILTDFTDYIDKNFVNETNPIKNEIFKISQNILNKDNNCVIYYATSNRYDADMFKKEIREDDSVSDRIKHNLIPEPWNKIFLELDKIHNGNSCMNQRCYIISSTHPTYSFYLTSDRTNSISKIIFIGTEERLTSIKNILDKRIVNKSLIQPIFLPENKSDIPNGLYEILSSINSDDYYQGSIKKLNDACYDDIDGYYYSERDNYTGDYHSSSDPNCSNLAMLKINDPVIVAENANKYGVFLSPDSSVMYVNEDGIIDDCNLKGKKKIKYQNLVGLNIILSITSYKRIFLEYMFLNQPDYKSRMAKYKWESFKELYLDSISWINYIENAIHNLNEKGDDGINIIINIISNATGKDPLTVKGWLRRDDDLISKYEEFCYPVYITEHPRKIDDLIIIEKALKPYVLNSDDYNLEKSYFAVEMLQEIRKLARKPSDSDSNPSLIKIRDDIRKKSRDIIMNLKESERFTPVHVYTDYTLKNNVYPKKIYKNYRDYI